MSELVSKSFQHLYRILKVYLLLGLIGALIGASYAFYTHYPFGAILLLTVATGLFIGKAFLSHVLRIHRRPPEYAELLFRSMLPLNERETVIGDISEVYSDMISRRPLLHAYFWYWKEIVVSIWVLSRYTSDIRSTVREILPFYEAHRDRFRY